LATTDLNTLAFEQKDGSITIDATLANNLIKLPGWASEFHIYLASATAGTFTLTDPSGSGQPFAGETWTRVWRAQGNNPNQNRYVWVASGSGSVTLSYLLY